MHSPPSNACTALIPSPRPPLQVSCKGCQLLVDGVVVVDVYQPLITGTAITLQSPCLTLAPRTVSGRQLARPGVGH